MDASNVNDEGSEPRYCQFIHQAAIYDNVDLLDCLLQGDEIKNINATDVCGRSAVYTAVSNGSLQCLKVLLDNGADPNIPAGSRLGNMTPLHEGVLNSKVSALSLLLEHGADTSMEDASGKTPLALAKHMQSRDAVTLLEMHLEVRQQKIERMSRKLCETCAGGNLESVQNVLASCGGMRRDIINLVTKGMSPLAIASKCGYADILELLLLEGPQCSIQKDTGYTLLHLACESGSAACIELLLENYPEMTEVRSVEHQIPLHSAVICNYLDVVKILLDFSYPKSHLKTYTDRNSGINYTSGIDINAQDCTGETPLHVACRNGFVDIANALASHSVCVEVEKSMTRSTSLRARTFEIERDTLERVPEEDDTSGPKESDSVPSTPTESHSTLKVSRSKQFQFVYPADIHLYTYSGFSPLQLAIRHQHDDVVKALLDSRPLPLASVMVYDKHTSLLLYAYEHGTSSILHHLLCHGLVDVDNKVLSSAIISQDRNIVQLMLIHKTSRDPNHAINKTEVRKAAFQAHQSSGNTQDTGTLNATDHEYRSKYPNVPVAVTWEAIGMLDSIRKQSLIDACLHHNPTLNLSMDASVLLCAITSVDLSKNSFQAFPSLVLELPSLVKLNLTRNQITSIPEGVNVLCVSLEELHLKENRLEWLPRFIFQLPVLKYLDASVNRIAEIPAEIWAAPSLISLNLSRNCLSWLPAWQRDPVLHRNSTTSSLLRFQSSSYSSMRRELAISYTGSIGSADFDQDEEENVGDNSATNFTILSMQNLNNNELKRVNKWSADITVVDRDPWKGSGKPSGLKQLWLNHNKLENFPPCLACCAPCLEVLEMSENPLCSAGNLSEYPPFLVSLDLSRTGLRSLDSWCSPPDTTSQDSLCLGIHHSPSQAKYSITSIPPSPAHSRSPTNASPTPSRNSFIATCPHRCHTSLVKLERLNLAFNKLATMCLTRQSDKDSKQADTYSICSMESEEIQSRLLFPKLSELNLSANMLTSLPHEIGEQGTLKILSLRRNLKLHELPPKLGLLKNLWKLDLECCPLDGVIQDFLQNSKFPVKDILGFLQSVLEESTEYNCMNLMLVGSHKIGKTSLLQKLNERGKPKNKPSHWNDRVNQDGVKKQLKQLSTVGIDINELVFEKRSHGQVIFRTWDFGGQREYYATHQYFLSPRSLYLVVWSIIDGERGVESLLQWLINIQARAPGAPVIIIGTHLDILSDKATRRNFPEDFEESMTCLIKKMFVANQEPDKSGLPCVLDTINVSCKTGENIKRLGDFIYDTAFQLKHPRSRTQNLIRQKIPRKYLLLQDIVRQLAVERAKSGKEPVLNRSKYTLCVQDKMMEKGMTFRDVEELAQATRFLHENGVLFHYDELHLRDFYFLDPQWLCDQLAKVITVKEINSFVQRGVMRVSSLEFLFKSQTVQPENIKVYITNLLSKFEVALQFDEEHLLLPSLLPTEMELQEMARKKSDVRIPLRKPKEASVYLGTERSSSPDPRYELLRSRKTGRRLVEGPPNTLHVGSSVFYTGSQIAKDAMTLTSPKDTSKLVLLTIKPSSNALLSRCRLYFMTYFPSGFWPRLITRILADDSLYPFARSLFMMPTELQSRSPEVNTLAEKDPEWRCWQSGLELFYLGFEMLRIREVFFTTSSYFCNYSECKIKCSIDSEWAYLDVLNSKILEITFPTDSLRFHVTDDNGPPIQNLENSKQFTTVHRNEVATAQMMVKIVEHIDNLLQDWYPDIGEQRFSQNCYGRYLVTRVIPCPHCLHREVTSQRSSKNDEQSWFLLNPNVPDMSMPVEINSTQADVKPRSSTVMDRGTKEDENLEAPLRRLRSMTEGEAMIYRQSSRDAEGVLFSWLVERYMLDSLENVNAICPVHGPVSPAYLIDGNGTSHLFSIAPDVSFQDLSLSLLMPPCARLDIGECIGEGNFGKVHKGLYFFEDSNEPEKVAVKVLSKSSWARRDITRGFQSYLELACSAYLTARQEISILSRLEHPNIVPLLGLCPQPLSLILMLAPMGALDSKLKQLNKDGEYMPIFIIRQIILQVARALSYLHSNHIIYRDLKSENVLVWELPNLGDCRPADSGTVDVKIADYGISRTVLPSGARGFGGTPPFIAPEILQHAGKGIYTEKVDTFSFGMFMFELLTCRMPFANISNPSNIICEGQRPPLTVQEVEMYPSYVLDLMTLSWSQEPEQRPSMEAILNIANCQQFCHLQDVLTLGSDLAIYQGCSLAFQATSSGSVFSDQLSSTVQSSQEFHSQVWLSSGYNGNNSLEIISFNSANRVESFKTLSLTSAPVIAMCIFDDIVWCADSQGSLQLFHCDTYGMIFEKKLPVQSGASCTVLNLHPVLEERRVLAVTMEGTIFECQLPGTVAFLEEAVMAIHDTEPCYSSTLVNGSSGYEVWLGQKKGTILVWSGQSHSVVCCLSHGPKIAQSSSVCAFLVTQSGLVKSSLHVWSYNYPGSVISLWNTTRRSLMDKLDCSQIVSTVDLPVLATSEQFECGQVSALSAIDHYLYIGTTRGCVLVTEAVSLVPLCLFQCHSNRDFFIKTILPIIPASQDSDDEASLKESGDDDDDDDDDDEERHHHLGCSGVVTVGMGYHNILKTFHPNMDLVPGSRLEENGPRRDLHANDTFLLSWSSKDWELY